MPELRHDLFEEARQLVEQVLEQSPDGIVLLDESGRITALNGAASRMTGYALSDLRTRPFWVFAPSRDHARYEAAFGRFVTSGVGHFVGHTRQIIIARKDGSEIPAELSVGVLRSGFTALVAIFRDLSARVAAEEALRRSEQNFRALIEGSPSAIAVHRDGHLLFANAAAGALLGVDPATIVGTPAAPFLLPDDRAPVLERAAAVLRTGEPSTTRELSIRRSDGELRVVEVASTAVDFGGQRAVASTARDITPRKRLEAEILRNERLAAVGRLAAGVAHEINNPLAYVLANLELVAAELGRRAATTPDLAEACELVVGAREGAERVRRIARDLTVFARPTGEGLEPVDLPRAAEQAIELAAGEIRHRARLVRELSPVPPVLAVEGRVVQVLLNLLINAAQAIPEGEAAEHAITVRTLVDGQGRAVVEVADSGEGIAPDHLERIFEPFFSTKAHAGTGLGLFVCQGIVARLGGTLTVESVPGRGCVFRVALPVGPAAAASDPESDPASATAAPAERARLLIVDDEPRLADVLARYLAEDHDTVPVVRAEEALALLAAGEQFDLLLCDLHMPEMSGMDLHAELERSHPELARSAVFLTGGAFTARAEEFLARVPNRRLEKPFDFGRLRAVVAQSLRAARRR